jgi:NPCBM/NEW2 domain
MRKLVATTVLALGLATVPSTAQAGSTWLISMKASTDQVVAGHKIVFKGTVHPKAAAAGEKVVLQEKSRPGKPWTDQRKATIAHNGTYQVADRPTTSYVHSYRVVMPATSKHDKGVSPTTTVKVYAWSNLIDHNNVNDNGMYFGPVDMNGTTYKSSVRAAYSDSSSIEFNLDHKCIKMRSTFGISDDSTTGGQAEVDVQSDGTQVYTHTFDLGQSQKAAVTLAKPLKLRLAAHNTSTTVGVYGLGAFGTPQVLCTH